MIELPEKDPFTAVYEKLRDGVLSGPFLRQLAPGNRVSLIDFYDVTVPDASTVDANSFPRIMLRPMGGGGTKIAATSSSSHVVRRYGWRLQSGPNQKLSAVQFPLEWLVIRSMARLHESPGGDRLGLDYVAGWNMDFDDSGNMDESLLLMGMEGWETMMNVTVSFSFNTAGLAEGI